MYGLNGNTATTDLVKLVNNSNYSVRIQVPDESGKGVKTIKGFLLNPFQFSGGNNWGSIFPLSEFTSAMGLNGMMNPLLSAGGRSQMTLESLWQTSASWQGSQKPDFNIELLFLAINKDSDPRYPMLDLLRGVFPGDGYNMANIKVGDVEVGKKMVDAANALREKLGKTSEAITGSSTIGESIIPKDFGTVGQKAPYGFGLNGATQKPISNTTITLSIGKWFKAFNLVAVSVQPTISKEITRDGFPLYISVNLTLTPYRMVSAEEVKNWFIGLQQPGVAHLHYDKGAL